jgi:hypothetical protein
MGPSRVTSNTKIERSLTLTFCDHALEIYHIRIIKLTHNARFRQEIQAILVRRSGLQRLDRNWQIGFSQQPESSLADIPELSAPDHTLNRDPCGIDLLREFAHGLLGVFVGVRVDVGFHPVGRGEEREGLGVDGSPGGRGGMAVEREGGAVHHVRAVQDVRALHWKRGEKGGGQKRDAGSM